MKHSLLVYTALLAGTCASLVLLATAIYAWPAGETTVTFTRYHEYHLELFVVLPLMFLLQIGALGAVLKSRAQGVKQ